MNFMDLFTRRQDASTIFDFEYYNSTSENLYLKEIALNSVINFVARSISQSDFRVYKNGKPDNGEINYKLNVRPNSNQSAGAFWHKLIYKLIRDNEVLVIQTDSKELLVADNFTIKLGNDLFPKTFTNVSVGSYSYQRSFDMNDVWYLTYSNEGVEKYIRDMNAEMSSLYSRLVDTVKRNNQIRALVKIDATNANLDSKKITEYIQKIKTAIDKGSVAIVPEMKGLDYEEITNNQGIGKESVADFTTLQNQLTDSVANLIGVPPALIHGQNEKLDANIKSYLKFCINPLIDMLEDELNAKLFKKKEFMNGSRVRVVGLNIPNIFEISEAADKLLASSNFNRNEIRREVGYESIPGGDEFLLTKNYDKLKGGEKNDNDNSN